MPESFPFELVTPERLLISENVEAVVLSSVEGEMTVLAKHQPTLVLLKPALLIVSSGKGTAMRFYVPGGVADVRPDGLTVLADRAVPVDELNVDLIDADIREAEAVLDAAETAEERRIASEKLEHLKEGRALLIKRMAMISQT